MSFRYYSNPMVMRYILFLACLVFLILATGCTTGPAPTSPIIQVTTVETAAPTTIPVPTGTTEQTLTDSDVTRCPSGKRSCGDGCYDPTGQSCCFGQIIPSYGLAECNGTCYDAHTQVCCAGTVREGRREWAECNGSCIDLNEKICNNGTIEDRPRSVSISYSTCGAPLYAPGYAPGVNYVRFCD
jgi:hypothetical protein